MIAGRGGRRSMGSITILGVAVGAALDDFGVFLGRQLQVICLGGFDQFDELVVEGFIEFFKALDIRGVLGRLVFAAGQGIVGELAGAVDAVDPGGNPLQLVGDDHGIDADHRVIEQDHLVLDDVDALGELVERRRAFGAVFVVAVFVVAVFVGGLDLFMRGFIVMCIGGVRLGG